MGVTNELHLYNKLIVNALRSILLEIFISYEIDYT